MQNYGNLSDYDFELLCRDIVQAKTGLRLSCFGKGPDGGIDAMNLYANDNADTAPSAIVQAKHYPRTPFSKLKSEALRLAEKLGAGRCKTLYFMTSMPLTANNIQKLKIALDGIAESVEVWGLQDIDDFLSSPEGNKVLFANFKLWVQSTNAINMLVNNSACIDSSQLQSSIEDKQDLFVPTEAFVSAEKILEAHGFVMLTGSPGVGKTTISQMLALRYAGNGFRLIYTTDADVARVKSTLSLDQDAREFILLDDFLGQSYWKASDVRPREIQSLISYCSRFPNKKLVLNSRLTILNEVRSKDSDFDFFLDDRKRSEYLIDANELSDYEKARILHAHLVRFNVAPEHLTSVLEKRAYLRIINHRNYNPRIIEYACNAKRIGEAAPSNFAHYMLERLDHPEDAWRNEYDNRLTKEDRILMNTLYSLSNTHILKQELELAYNYRLRQTEGIDCSLNHFDDSLRRLSDSMVQVSTNGSSTFCSASNPSVNDFLATAIAANEIESRTIIACAISTKQLERIFRITNYPEVRSEVIEKMKDDSYWELDSPETVAKTTLEMLSLVDRMDKDTVDIGTRALNIAASSKSWEMPYAIGRYLKNIICLLSKDYDSHKSTMQAFKQFTQSPLIEYAAERVSLDTLDDFMQAATENLDLRERIDCYKKLSQEIPQRIACEIADDLYYKSSVDEGVSELVQGSTDDICEESDEWKTCRNEILKSIKEDARSMISDYLERYPHLSSLLTESDIDTDEAVEEAVDIDEEMRQSLEVHEDNNDEPSRDRTSLFSNNQQEIDAIFDSLREQAREDYLH